METALIKKENNLCSHEIDMIEKSVKA